MAGRTFMAKMELIRLRKMKASTKIQQYLRRIVAQNYAERLRQARILAAKIKVAIKF